MSDTLSTTPRIILLLLFAATILYEGWALGTGHVEYSISYNAWTIRHDTVGRFIMWMFFCWFFVHIILAPYWLGVQPDGWRGLLALALGFVMALGELLLHKH